RRVEPVRIGRRTLEVINLPAPEMRPADIPLLTLAVGLEDERALARANEDPDSAHFSSSLLFRGASPLGLPYAGARGAPWPAPLRRCAASGRAVTRTDLAKGWSIAGTADRQASLRYSNPVTFRNFCAVMALLAVAYAPAQARQDPALRERVNRVGS